MNDNRRAGTHLVAFRPFLKTHAWVSAGILHIR